MVWYQCQNSKSLMQVLVTSCKQSKLYASGQNFMQAVQNFIPAAKTLICTSGTGRENFMQVVLKSKSYGTILASPICMNVTYTTVCDLKPRALRLYRVMASNWDRPEINSFERAKRLLLGAVDTDCQQYTYTRRSITIVDSSTCACACKHPSLCYQVSRGCPELPLQHLNWHNTNFVLQDALREGGKKFSPRKHLKVWHE